MCDQFFSDQVSAELVLHKQRKDSLKELDICSLLAIEKRMLYLWFLYLERSGGSNVCFSLMVGLLQPTLLF